MSENGEDVVAAEDAPLATADDIADRLGVDVETVLEAVEPSSTPMSLPDVDQHEFSRLCDILHFAQENTVTGCEEIHIKELKKKLIHEAEHVERASEPQRAIPFYVLQSAHEGAEEGHEYAVVRSDNDYEYARTLAEANEKADAMRSAAETVSPYNHSVQVIDLQEPEA